MTNTDPICQRCGIYLAWHGDFGCAAMLQPVAPLFTTNVFAPIPPLPPPPEDALTRFRRARMQARTARRR